MDAERITLRLERDNLEKIDTFLQAHRDYQSRSQLVREAVRTFVRAIEQRDDTVTVRVPWKYLELMDHLVAAGLYLDREHSVLRAIEAWFDAEGVKATQEHLKTVDRTTGKIVEVTDGQKDGVIPP